MQTVVITDDAMREELLAQATVIPSSFHFIQHEEEWPQHVSATACIDLCFNGSPERTYWLKQRACKLTIIQSVAATLTETDESFIRINAWPGFLKRNIVEASCLQEELRKDTEGLFALLGKSIEWIPDICGFVSPRVVASVINEAFYALEEDISSEKEIDTAMKLGTNYPFGPFEWAEKIGLKKVYSLLQMLSRQEFRYTPCKLLEKKALA